MIIVIDFISVKKKYGVIITIIIQKGKKIFKFLNDLHVVVEKLTGTQTEKFLHVFLNLKRKLFSISNET